MVKKILDCVNNKIKSAPHMQGLLPAHVDALVW